MVKSTRNKQIFFRFYGTKQFLWWGVWDHAQTDEGWIQRENSRPADRHVKYPSAASQLLIEEGGKDPHDAINFINKIADQLAEYKEEENAGDYQGDPDALPPNKGKKQSKASTTQGLLHGAPQAHTTEGTAAITAKQADGDKEGMQIMSMAPGG